MGQRSRRKPIGFLTDDELAGLIPRRRCPALRRADPDADRLQRRVSCRRPQSPQQKQVEARLLAMADDLGGKQGMDRRKFFQTAAGMAASFVAMNEVYGPLFDVSKAEAATPAMAQERASALKDQFIMDMHTHFLRDDTRIKTFVASARRSARPAGTRRWPASRRRSRISSSPTTSRRSSSTATPRSR